MNKSPIRVEPLTFESLYSIYYKFYEKYGEPKMLECSPEVYERLQIYLQEKLIEMYMDTDNPIFIEPRIKIDPKATLYGMVIRVDKGMKRREWRLVDAI